MFKSPLILEFPTTSKVQCLVNSTATQSSFLLIDVVAKVQPRTITVRRECTGDGMCASCSELVGSVCVCNPRVASSSSPGRATEILFDTSLQNNMLIIATSTDGLQIECPIINPQPYDVYKFNYLWQCSKSDDSLCLQRRNCSSCLASSDCNWCGEWGLCYPKGSADYSACETVASVESQCCIATEDCSTCLQAGCGWCNYHECLPGTVTGPGLGFNDSVHGAPRCHVWKYPRNHTSIATTCAVIPPEDTFPVYEDPETQIKRIAQGSFFVVVTNSC